MAASVRKGAFKVTRKITLSGVPLSEEEFLAGIPAVQTMEAALAAGVVNHQAFEEKMEQIELVLLRARRREDGGAD
ncbi:MAG: hypothetical protein FWG72_00450 [Oscillospiraceae bacterium]|nr:hypothetical protein [Oscillospiraceae bacterium]